MKLHLIAALIAALFALPAFADGGAKDVKASSTSITGASVLVVGTGSGYAASFDKSGAGAKSYVGGNGHYQSSSNSAYAYSYGGSVAGGSHYGHGFTSAKAFEYSHAEAQAGSKRRYSHNYSNGE